jgi:hypothetical protein
VEVGSVRSIINAQTLRPFLIEAVQRGMENVLDRVSPATVTDGASGTESNGHGLAQPTPR